MRHDKAVERHQDPPQGGFRQAMAWLHTWAGLALGWVLFFVFVTGTLGYFDTEIDRWMQPELPPSQAGLPAREVAPMLLTRLAAQAPGAERWQLRLPVDRNQPWPVIRWQDADPDAGATAANGEETLNGRSGLPLVARETGGGQHLYQMHWRLHYLGRGISDWIISLATLFMLVALITGVVVHRRIFRDFFTFRPGKGQRSWLDAHNLLSVVSLPFQLMITYSGLVFMGFSFMPLIVAAHYGVDREGRQQFFDEVFEAPGLVAPAAEPAPLVPLDGLLAEAEARWGEGRIRFVDIRHPGDRNARVILRESRDASVASGGRLLVFDGVSGERLHSGDGSGSARTVRDTLTGLHEGLFAATGLRWLYFFSGLLGCGMVATGLVLWGVKRRQQAQRRTGAAPLGLRLVERLNVGTVAGLPVAIAAYFWANRLLPPGLAERAAWEAHALFLTWLALMLHALLRKPGRAWVEQLSLAAIAWGTLPLLNALTTDRHLLHSLPRGDWALAGIDLVALVFGLGCATLAAWLRARHLSRQALSPVAPQRPASERQWGQA